MLTDNDILIIQGKVDDTLTEKEEAVFHALTGSNPDAAALYEELLCVQQKLRDDAARIPAMDVTGSVMSAIRHKAGVSAVFPGVLKKYYAFAALFVLVFALGVLAANYLIPPLGSLNNEELTGTMAGKHTDAFKDQEAGVEIDLEAYRKEGLLIYTLFVKSRDSLHVEFVSGRDHSESLYFKRIWPGNEPETGLIQDRHVYAVCGENAIFTITNPPVHSEMFFLSNGKLIHKIHF